MKDMSLPPDAPALIESIRAIGYTLEAAIADIIDNSIPASASNVEIIYFPKGEPYIAVLDNGTGMNEDELNNAMRYGSQNPNEKRSVKDLGRFGMGLKTASLSQCRTLTVATKRGSSIAARRWDIDHVIKKNDWSLLILDSKNELDSIPHIEKLRKLKSGTLVVWQNLDRLEAGEVNLEQALGRKMDEVRRHLSLVFHRYINGEAGLKKIHIKMNNTTVSGSDPFFISRNTQVMDEESLCIEDSIVTIRPYIIPHISRLSQKEIIELGGKDGLRKSQGFYVYRNKRLLIWGTWFRMLRKEELSKLARVQVDIPNELDQLWTIDIKKSTAIPPEIVRNSLKPLIEQLANKSKNTWEFRGKSETLESVIHLWERIRGRDGYYYRINREHPFVKLIDTASPHVSGNLATLLKAIETSLPLNQLYIDLNSERRVENAIDLTEKEIEKILFDLLEQIPTKVAKLEFLEKIASSDPFTKFPQCIVHQKKGLEL